MRRMTLVDLRALHNRTVLVRSTRDRRNPPTAYRGTIEVHEDPVRRGEPLVQIVLTFPQMFATRVHSRTLTLCPADIEHLLRHENHGAYEFTVDDLIDPAAGPENE